MANDAARITEITTELKAILEARLSELGAAMKGTESVTRQIVSAELEISRYKHLQESLAGEAVEVKREMAALRARAEEARSSHGGLVAERDSLRSEASRLEAEARDAAGERERLRVRSQALQAETDAGMAEAEALRTKIAKQEENHAKVRKLKEELKAQLAALSAGAKE
jgi:chromosome segregation ATPase